MPGLRGEVSRRRRVPSVPYRPDVADDRRRPRVRREVSCPRSAPARRFAVVAAVVVGGPAAASRRVNRGRLHFRRSPRKVAARMPHPTDKSRIDADDEQGPLTARLLRAGNRFYVRAFHRVVVQTPPQLPRKGAAILVCNHISGLDPVLLQAVISRPIIWMMAREYYEIAALRWVYEAVDAIPVDRNGRDSSATRAALRALSAGRVLGIFPEGKLETSRELLPFQTGVAMMAIRTGTPVVPAYLEGSNRGMEMLEAFVNPNDVRIRFGPPVELSKAGPGGKPDLDRCTQAITDSVAKLKREMT